MIPTSRVILERGRGRTAVNLAPNHLMGASRDKASGIFLGLRNGALASSGVSGKHSYIFLLLHDS